MGGKSGGNTTTTQKADPWSGQQPFLKFGFNQAQNLYNSGGPQFYPGRTYVPFSGQTEQALGMAQNRAGGSPLEGQLNNYLGNALGGGFLNSNPYMDAMYGNAARGVTKSFNESVMPSINATFGGAGRTGSGLHSATVANAAGQLGDSLSGMAANLYGGNYDAERARMQQAAGMVPMASLLDWQNIGQLGGVGQQVEGKAGEILGDSMSRFNYYQGLPEENLGRYIAAIQGNYGSASTTNQSGPGSNPLAGALGGGLAGGALGGMLGGVGGGTAAALGTKSVAGALGMSNPYLWPLVIGGAALGAFS